MHRNRPKRGKEDIQAVDHLIANEVADEKLDVGGGKWK